MNVDMSFVLFPYLCLFSDGIDRGQNVLMKIIIIKHFN